MTRTILTILLFTILTSFQTKVDKSLLTGKWKLTSHFYLTGTKKQYCDTKVYSPEITLLSDGTYIMTLKGKKVQKGKWKINSGDILFLYNNQDIPDDPKVVIVDHGNKILSVDNEKLLLKEVICDEATEGQSTYTRMK